MKCITSSVLTIALTVSLIKPAKATPAVLAPIALCSTGIGCVLVGTAIVGSIVVYVWKRSDGKKIQSDAKGNVLRMMEDPNDFESEVLIGTLTATNQTSAARQCKAIAFKRGMKYLRVEPRGGKFVCIAK